MSQEAVSYLGLEVVRDLVLNLGAFSCEEIPAGLSPSLSAIADRSFTVASVAREIAPPEYGESAYAAGLLIDVGQVVMATRMPDAFTKIASQCQETGGARWALESASSAQITGQIGAFLLTQWGLPHDLTCARGLLSSAPRGRLSARPAAHDPARGGNALTDELSPGGWPDGSALDTEYLEAAGVLDRLSEWREAAATAARVEND